MRRMLWMVGVLLLACLCWAQAAPYEDPTPNDLLAEESWLQSFGLKVPEGGLWTVSPFYEPWTNRSFLLPHTWYPKTPPARIDPTDLRADLPLLRTAMTSAYAGWQTAEARGWNWDAWFARWDKLLAQHDERAMRYDDALAPFAELHDFQRDNLSGPFADHRGQCGSRCVWAAHPLPADCDAVRTADGQPHLLAKNDAAQRPRTAFVMLAAIDPDDSRFRITSYLSCPTDLGTVKAVRSRGRWLPLYQVWTPSNDERLQTILSMTGSSTDVPTYRSISRAIGYLRLPTFDLQSTQWLDQVLSHLSLDMARRSLLVVDLRDSAGDDEPVDQLAPVLGLPTLKRPEMATSQCTSPLAIAFGWGEAQSMLANLSGPLQRSQFAQAKAALDAVDDPAPDGDLTQHRGGEWDYQRHVALRGADRDPNHPRLLVLVDSHTAGAAERLVWQLSARPGAVIAGTNTYGQGGFTDPGSFLLPHSRIPIRLARAATDAYGDGRSLDAYGLDVDVLLPTAASQRPSAILHLADVLAAHPGFRL